jgi:hypothetical protein
MHTHEYDPPYDPARHDLQRTTDFIMMMAILNAKPLEGEKKKRAMTICIIYAVVMLVLMAGMLLWMYFSWN